METEISIVTNQTRNISGIDKLPTIPPTIDTEIMTIEDDDPNDPEEDNVFIADRMADEDTNDFIPAKNTKLLSDVFSPSTSPKPGSVNALLEASSQNQT